MLTGERIKTIRKDMKLPQKDVAARAGMSSQQLWQIENSKYVPTLPTLVKISVALGWPVQTLVGEDFKFSSTEYREYLATPDGQKLEPKIDEIDDWFSENISFPDESPVPEDKILLLFRSLDDEDKGKAIDYLSLLRKQEKYNS